MDRIVNQLEQLRAERELTKAQMARMTGHRPAAVRRLMAAERANPTIGTLSELAATVGYKIALVPMDEEERATSRRLLELDV